MSEDLRGRDFFPDVAGAIDGSIADASSLAATDLRVNHQVAPLGIDEPRPSFSWRLVSDRRSTLQTAYQIRVRGPTPNVEIVWDSGKIGVEASVHCRYQGQPLDSRQAYEWQVRVWDNHGRESPWSDPARWEMGLPGATAWQAHWISVDHEPGEAPLLRHGFNLRSGIRRARAYATARGLYHLYLNGSRVSEDEFRPGFTSYSKRLQYQTYDVTRLLRQGVNAVGAILGEGWFAGCYTWGGRRRDIFGNRTALLVQIEIEYVDGQREVILTDGRWRCARGPIIHSSLYDGEIFDSRLQPVGWSDAEFNDDRWENVRIIDAPTDTLIAQEGPSVRRIEEVAPKRIIELADGRVIVDMGQNLAGWVRLSVEGRAGTTVTLRHGEMLTPEGGLYTGNLMGAKQTITFTLNGNGREIYEPHFTYHGFRYVEVSDYPGTVTPDSITAVVLHSDLEPAGCFEVSNPLLAQLQHNIVWSMKSNFLEIPTDNPQRAERLGWAADAQLFAPTAAFNLNVAAFFGRWLKDLAADQKPDGGVPWTIPDALGEAEEAAIHSFSKLMPTPPRHQPGDNPNDHTSVGVWGDAAVFLPWSHYLIYGNLAILEAQYDSMVRWVSYQEFRAGDDLIWDGDFQFGDWLDFGSEGRANFGATGSDLVVTAYFARSAKILSLAATALGRQDDAKRYTDLSAAVTQAFQQRFVANDGCVGDGTQAAQVLALAFNLVPHEQRAEAARRLANDVRDRGHLTTGLAATVWLLPVLTEAGYIEDAYGLLLREEYPSWLYQVKSGATTMWERWDSIEPNGSIHTSTGMNSFNQYVFGSIGQWMYETVAGLATDHSSPGFKTILVQPRPGGGLTWASATHATPYGKARLAWQIARNRFELVVHVPPNATARVTLPGAARELVQESGIPLRRAIGVLSEQREGPDLVIGIGSGHYSFSYQWHRQSDPGGVEALPDSSKSPYHGISRLYESAARIYLQQSKSPTFLHLL